MKEYCVHPLWNGNSLGCQGCKTQYISALGNVGLQSYVYAYSCHHVGSRPRFLHCVAVHLRLDWHNWLRWQIPLGRRYLLNHPKVVTLADLSFCLSREILSWIFPASSSLTQPSSSTRPSSLTWMLRPGRQSRTLIHPQSSGCEVGSSLVHSQCSLKAIFVSSENISICAN